MYVAPPARHLLVIDGVIRLGLEAVDYRMTQARLWLADMVRGHER